MLNGEKAEESLRYVKKLQEKEGIDIKAAEKLERLYNYLAMNRDGIVPYYLREGLKMPVRTGWADIQALRNNGTQCVRHTGSKNEAQ